MQSADLPPHPAYGVFSKLLPKASGIPSRSQPAAAVSARKTTAGAVPQAMGQRTTGGLTRGQQQQQLQQQVDPKQRRQTDPKQQQDADDDDDTAGFHSPDKAGSLKQVGGGGQKTLARAGGGYVTRFPTVCYSTSICL